MPCELLHTIENPDRVLFDLVVAWTHRDRVAAPVRVLLIYGLPETPGSPHPSASPCCGWSPAYVDIRLHLLKRQADPHEAVAHPEMVERLFPRALQVKTGGVEIGDEIDQRDLPGPAVVSAGLRGARSSGQRRAAR